MCVDWLERQGHAAYRQGHLVYAAPKALANGIGVARSGIRRRGHSGSAQASRRAFPPVSKRPRPWRRLRSVRSRA